jgi:pyruvate-formate lyase-activating enzyme
MYKKKGLIFHIIHGSFVDGHGIRTTVFLKGCPLRCVWCCNPEGQVLSHELKFTESLCDGCYKCLDICPVDAIKSSEIEGDTIIIDRTRCTKYHECIDVCSKSALDYFGNIILLIN